MHPFDPWRVQLLVGLVFCVGLIACRPKAKPLGLAWAYYLLSAAFTFMAVWEHHDGPIGPILDISTGQAFALLLALPLPFLLWPGLRLRHWSLFFVTAALAEGVGILSGSYDLFVGGAPGFGSAYIAAAFPLARWPFQLFLLAPIWKAHGATAFMILGVQLLVYAWLHRHRFWPLLGVSLLAGVGYFTQGHELYQDPQRLAMWRAFTDWWWHHANIWVGTGVGTFQWLGPEIQAWTPPLWFFLHNDWLQLLFETGIIGLLLAVGIFGWTLTRARTTLKPTVAGLGAFMLTFAPLHFFLPAFFIVCILNEVHE